MSGLPIVTMVGGVCFEAWTATDMVVSKRAGSIEIKPGLNYMLVDGKKLQLTCRHGR
jgi:hypothetical protein